MIGDAIASVLSYLIKEPFPRDSYASRTFLRKLEAICIQDDIIGMRLNNGSVFFSTLVE